ncbi:Very-long-chain (3R)-3-hydroxyacyl-CoA dehydratase, partial [Caligus rogercresseyi]
VYNQLQKHELGFVSESKRKVYLFIYNLFMFCSYIYIFSIMNLRYARLGDDFIPLAYKTLGNPLKMVSLLSLLEILHPLFGYTRTSSLNAFFSVGTRIQEKPVVFYTFTLYCLMGLAKYPYYVLRTYDIQQGFITWLRYTLWIPLYPAAFICEGVIVLRNIPYFEETQKFTLSLPNALNNISPLRLLSDTLCLHAGHVSTKMQKLNVKQYKKNKIF